MDNIGTFGSLQFYFLHLSQKYHSTVAFVKNQSRTIKYRMNVKK